MPHTNRGGTPPPDAALIQRRRTNRGLDGPLSIARCAEMLREYTAHTFTDRTWANYEQGKTPIPDRALVLMSLVVGATPEELDSVGRQEAGAMLASELATRSSDSMLPRETQQRLEQAIRDIQEMPGLGDEQRQKMVELLLEKVHTLLDQHRAQVEIMRPPTP